MATELVANHLKTHQLGARGQDWLKYGTAHAPKDHCPYCAQNTIGVPLVDAYRTYFSEAFKSLSGQIDNLKCIVDLYSLEKLNELVLYNDIEFDYWVKLCDIEPIPTLSPVDRGSIANSLQLLSQLIDEKRQNPLAKLALGSNAPSIHGAISLLQAYNEQIASRHAIIDLARSGAEGGDLEEARRIHGKWLAINEKLRDPVRSAVISFNNAQNRLGEIKKEKSAAQAALKAYTEATMVSRQSAINEILSDFGASFQIVDARTNFTGREPNAEFAIEIRKQKVKAGEILAEEPSFKTVLSAGDKITLALAFFIAQIQSDVNLKEAVVVFDDPFSSQDMDRQFYTTSHIREICKNSRQTLVLSHDPRFLQLIEKTQTSL
ncbi:AAA family ATPase [Roseomonas sp. F4]